MQFLTHRSLDQRWKASGKMISGALAELPAP
jgi:hypothetical protein